MTEHDDVIRLLREGRPQATEMELDQIKQRIRRRAAAPSGRKQGMKSRLAILGMLVAGMVFSTAGASLALDGLTTNNASVAQYVTPTPTPTCSTMPTGGTSPGGSPSGECSPTPTCTDTSGDTSPASGSPNADCSPTPEGGVAPATASSTPTPAATTAAGNGPAGGVAPTVASNTQPVRQQEAATNTQLPFTGFAAIPVLLGGLALLTGGLLLRRRTRSEE